MNSENIIEESTNEVTSHSKSYDQHAYFVL